MYKVVLVDDEQLILKGLSRVIRWEEMNCTIAGTASDGAEGLRLIQALSPDILLTDIRMPNMDGLTMVAALKTEFPRMQVSVLTAYRDFDYAQQAIRLGVCRYLCKPSKMNELTEAIQTMTAQLDALESAPVHGTLCPSAENIVENDAGSFIVHAALEFMQAHCTEHISLSDVAEGVYVSQWHLSKLLNRHTHQTFFDLLGGMRVERAKQLLHDPAMRIHDVAEKSGYSDVAHFSRSFKKMTGRTPGEYRDALAREKM